MKRKPQRPYESVLSVQLGLAILVQGLLVGFVGPIAFGLSYDALSGFGFVSSSETPRQKSPIVKKFAGSTIGLFPRFPRLQFRDFLGA